MAIALSVLAAVCAQVRFQLEQTREGLQRQLAATDGQMHVLQARLGDSQAEQQVRLQLTFDPSSPMTLQSPYCPTRSLSSKSACPPNNQCLGQEAS